MRFPLGLQGLRRILGRCLFSPECVIHLSVLHTNSRQQKNKKEKKEKERGNNKARQGLGHEIHVAWRASVSEDPPRNSYGSGAFLSQVLFSLPQLIRAMH